MRVWVCSSRSARGREGRGSLRGLGTWGVVVCLPVLLLGPVCLGRMQPVRNPSGQPTCNACYRCCAAPQSTDPGPVVVGSATPWLGWGPRSSFKFVPASVAGRQAVAACDSCKPPPPFHAYILTRQRGPKQVLQPHPGREGCRLVGRGRLGQCHTANACGGGPCKCGATWHARPPHESTWPIVVCLQTRRSGPGLTRNSKGPGVGRLPTNFVQC